MMMMVIFFGDNGGIFVGDNGLDLYVQWLIDRLENNLFHWDAVVKKEQNGDISKTFEISQFSIAL